MMTKLQTLLWARSGLWASRVSPMRELAVTAAAPLPHLCADYPCVIVSFEVADPNRNLFGPAGAKGGNIGGLVKNLRSQTSARRKDAEKRVSRTKYEW
eukprot:775120-Rhodomonas_salina.1